MDSLIWADSGIYEYSTRFSILSAVWEVQDLGKERVEERVTGVDEVEAMRDEFSLLLKTKDQNRNKDLNYINKNVYETKDNTVKL